MAFDQIMHKERCFESLLEIFYKFVYILKYVFVHIIALMLTLFDL